MLLLAADIGGTKSWLQARDCSSGQLVAEDVFASADFTSLETLLNHFRQQHGIAGFAATCLGVPGPVNGRQAQLTNLPWSLCADRLEQQCATGPLKLINDFQAAALGIETLEAGQQIVLHVGQPDPKGHRLVVGAGTGLGVCPVFRDRQAYVPVACEGGHMDFAPSCARQQALQSWLWPHWPHLSFERVLSGPGLEVLYRFCSGAAEPQGAPYIRAPEITALANAGQPAAVEALELFVSLYGSFLGNLALLWPARGGIYIAGGIAAKILPWIQQPAFLQALHAKGRMQAVVQEMPVILVTEAALGLQGAMLQAQRMITTTQSFEGV